MLDLSSCPHDIEVNSSCYKFWLNFYERTETKTKLTLPSKKSDDHAKSLLTSITNLHLRNIFSNGVENNIQ